MFYALQNIEVNNNKQCCLLKSKAFTISWLGKICSVKKKSVGKLPSDLLYKFFYNVFSSEEFVLVQEKKTERGWIQHFWKKYWYLVILFIAIFALLSLWAFDFFFFGNDFTLCGAENAGNSQLTAVFEIELVILLTCKSIFISYGRWCFLESIIGWLYGWKWRIFSASSFSQAISKEV